MYYLKIAKGHTQNNVTCVIVRALIQWLYDLNLLGHPFLLKLDHYLITASIFDSAATLASFTFCFSVSFFLFFCPKTRGTFCGTCDRLQ